MQQSYIGPTDFEFKDSQFMTAEDKKKVLKHWETFLKNGCQREHFTKDLYHHLTLHCSFIAHYDIHGFYATYFERGDDTVQFLSQFDNRKGIPRSIEYGMTYWITDPDYYDINIAMCQVAQKYLDTLIAAAKASQRETDIAQARALLAKHGLKSQF